jgi:rubrerythrin
MAPNASIGVLMSKKDPTVEKLKGYARFEEDYAVKLNKDFRGLGNEALREIIDSIAIDSKKHAGLFKACAYILSGRSLSITDTEYDQLEKSLKDHEATEVKMLRQIDGLLKVIKDERIVMMLNHIRDDEYRHHELLRNLNEAVIKREVILEKDVWNQLFRDALTHGHAPPGPFEVP